MSTKDRIKAAFGLHKAKTADLQPSINAEAENEDGEEHSLVTEELERTEVIVAEELVVKPEVITVDVEKLTAENRQMTERLAAIETERKAEQLAARKGQLKLKAEGFKALPVQPETFIEKMSALEGASPELAQWVMGEFERLDTVLQEGGLLREIGSSLPGETDPTKKFLAAVDQIVKDQFNSNPAKYSEALAVASRQYPELAKTYAGVA